MTLRRCGLYTSQTCTKRPCTCAAPSARDRAESPGCGMQDGCASPVLCRMDGECHFTAPSHQVVNTGPYSTCAACPHEHTADMCCHKTRILSSARDRAESNCCGKAPGSCLDCPLIVRPTNPKQLFGDKKLPLYLVPFSTVAYLSVALFEGMKKYGLVNWRASPVEAMTYASAAKRHIETWIGGQRCDPKTRVHHIASMMACGTILLDAELNGTLIDNRPMPIAQDKIDALIVDLETTLDNLRALHADKNPRHFTIAIKPAGV